MSGFFWQPENQQREIAPSGESKGTVLLIHAVREFSDQLCLAMQSISAARYRVIGDHYIRLHRRLDV